LPTLYEALVPYGASLGIGLLIGLERERNPAAKAGVRTFALVALLGTLAVSITPSVWLMATGLAAVAATLIVAHAHEPHGEDPGTTTVVAAAVCYLLGVLAGLGKPGLAGSLAIGVTALLYFKPEIEGFSAGLKRHEQVSVLQFLVLTFIVLPILPDRGYGPYEALNPRNIWLMVVLVSGLGLATYVALRVAGQRHGVLTAGILGGLLSSTAATFLYARRSRDSASMERVALAVVPFANLVPLARVAVIAAVVAPAILTVLLPVLGAALAAGLAVAALFMRGAQGGDAPLPESRNPAELGTALRFGAFYAVILVLAAWLSDVFGSRGLYAAALASGTVDIDPINLSALNLFGQGYLSAEIAVTAIALAYLANVLFKLSVLVWFNRRLAWRALWPLAATLAAGAVVLAAR
jgi:uncharacterized membrane protein (DUF4010 family)